MKTIITKNKQTAIDFISENMTENEHMITIEQIKSVNKKLLSVYYAGILPEFCNLYGESDPNYAHWFVLKKHFLRVNIENEIPKKYLRRKPPMIFTKIENGIEKIDYIIPSLTHLEEQELRDYIKKCEILISELGGDKKNIENRINVLTN